MRSDTGTAGRVRTVIALAVAGAAALMAGLLIMVVGAGLQAVSKHPEAHVIALGAAVAIIGFVFGMVVLALFVLTRGGTMFGARQGASDPEAAREPAREASDGPDRQGREHAQASHQAGAARAASGRTGSGRPGRSRGNQVLDPTGVYSPGGLLAMPGEPGRAAGAGEPGRAAGAGEPGRAAGTGPMPRMTGPQPRMTGPQPAYRPGMSAPRAGMTGPQPKAQSGMTGPQPVFQQGRSGGPAGRDPREQPGRDRRPGQGQPVHPPRPGVPSQPGGQGQVPRAGQQSPAQPAAQARSQPQAQRAPQPGQQGPAQAAPAQPAGPPRWPGYEFVEQARPSAPQSPAAQPPGAQPPAAQMPDSPDVYVYRDTGEPDDYPATAASPGGPVAAEKDAAYWYGPPPDAAGAPAGAPAEETRGPFEPLISSADVHAASPAMSAEPAGAAHGQFDAALADPDGAGEEENPAESHAAKLEQIKDLYLTAEAIGEENVDKHFDTLLAQQRELISDFFKSSGIRRETERPPDLPEEAASAGEAAAT